MKEQIKLYERYQICCIEANDIAQVIRTNLKS